MWVDPKFLFRPTPDPEISDHEAGLTSPFSDRFIKVEEKHKVWLNEKRNDSFKKESNEKYDKNAQPWTALGYTYDWGNPQTEVGLSEFVIEGNPEKLAESSSVEVISITPTANYCTTSNIEGTQTTDNKSDVLNISQSTFQNPTNTMLIPNILNVAINLLFIYLAVSLLVSALQEQIVALLALRAKNLKSSIATLLGDEDRKNKLLTENLYKHPLIKSLNQQGNKWLKKRISFLKWKSVGPSYLKSQTFSDILLDLLRRDHGLDFDNYSDRLDRIINKLETELERRRQKQNNDNETSKLFELPDELLENLYALARQTKNRADEGTATIKEFQENLANWFDESMERATGVYKRNALGLSLLLGLIIAIIGNIDTIHIINQLYNDPALNETLSAFATQQINTIESECKDQSTEEEANCLQSKFKEINVNDIRSFPIGWEVQPKNQAVKSNFFNYDIHLKRQQSFFLTIFGWLITAFALAQGAPFWFNLLNKVIDVRSSGKRYDQSSQERTTQPEETTRQ